MPVVTVSRMYGSGGSEVAQGIARRLGFPVLDDALVDEVAARLGSTRAEVQARAERVPSLVERIAEALTLGSQEVMAATLSRSLPPTEARVLEVTRRVIDEAVGQGPVVLVGRGAQQMLARRVDAVHVLCYAPPAALVERVMRREGLDAPTAERLVSETNDRREQYTRRNWSRSWLGHENYHLCLNTAWLGIEASAELAAQTARALLGVRGAE
jgi:cytidylate kinase